MRTEQSYRSWPMTTAARLEAEAAALEAKADEEEAYSCGSRLMGGTGASSHLFDMERVERWRAQARRLRSEAQEYRTKARQQSA